MLSISKNDVGGLTSGLTGDPKGIGLVLFALAIVPSLLSFFPRLSKRFGRSQRQMDHGNILYFAHAALLTKQEYLQRFAERRLSFIGGASQSADFKELESLCLDYADQIVEVSIIAVGKYRLFRWALILTFLGLLDILGGLVLAFYNA